MQFTNLYRSVHDFGNRLLPVTKVLLKAALAIWAFVLLGLLLYDPYVRHQHAPPHQSALAVLGLCLVGMLWEMVPREPVPYRPWKELWRRYRQSKSFWWGVLVLLPTIFGMEWVTFAHGGELPITLYAIGSTLLTIIVRPHRRWPLY